MNTKAEDYADALLIWLYDQPLNDGWISMNDKFKADAQDVWSIKKVFHLLQRKREVETLPTAENVHVDDVTNHDGSPKHDKSTFENTEYKLKLTVFGKEEWYRRNATKKAAQLTSAQLADLPESIERSWISMVIAILGFLVALYAALKPN